MDNNLLGSINSPDDIRKMSFGDLDKLSTEINKYIIDVVSKNGGHLASNLGTVDLTLALHYTFNTPGDKIIWDVGHQTYAHKIITGRKEEFKSIRQFGGLSGFPKRTESEYDIYDTGHSSTSISAGIGIKRALTLQGSDSKVVAVIGDGALTGGMAFEALNDAGHSRDNIMVVLNDNSMSISQNVGGMSNYLTKIRISKGYNSFKHGIIKTLDRIPKIGSPIFGFLERLKNSTKYLLSGGKYFEDMGIKYVGPVDGHNIKKLTETFKASANYDGPVIVHVVTKKGKGYKIAQTRPDKYHSTGPFDISSGNANGKKTITPSTIIGKTLCDLAKQDESICAITAAMTSGCGLGDFHEQFPSRFFDVAIAEQHAVSMAAGMAATGFKPVFCVYSSFLQRAYDQLITDVCLQNLNVVFAVSHSGIVSGDGETHQGIFDYSYLRAVPNLSIFVPASLEEVAIVLKKALDTKGPVAICYPKSGLPLVNSIQPMDNGDVLLITMGRMMSTALNVKDKLEGKISIDIHNVDVLKPLDIEPIEDIIGKYSRVYVLEDNLLAGGFYAAIMEGLKSFPKDTEINSISIKDMFIPHGDMKSIEKFMGFDATSIADKILTESAK